MITLNLSSEIFSHPLLGMYENDLQILGDIIEPILDEKAWANTDNEWENYVQPKYH